jgi:hypothetical protein
MENNKKLGRFGVSSIILGSAIMTPIVLLFVFPLLKAVAGGDHLLTALNNIYLSDDLGRIVVAAIGAVIFGTLVDLAWLSAHRKEHEWERRSILFKLIIIGFLAALLPTFFASIISG